MINSKENVVNVVNLGGNGSKGGFFSFFGEDDSICVFVFDFRSEVERLARFGSRRSDEVIWPGGYPARACRPEVTSHPRGSECAYRMCGIGSPSEPSTSHSRTLFHFCYVFP